MSTAPLDPLPLDNDEPIEIDLDAESPDDAPREIRTFGAKKEAGEKAWKRQTTVTGNGAIRVKTFHAKLREDALEFMDEQINRWLDDHPEFEIKFVSTTVGELRGKTVEAALFLNVWY